LKDFTWKDWSETCLEKFVKGTKEATRKNP